jgi:predicted dehydrogenase
MIKVGIIGCGKIADQHAEAIRYLSGCEIVGVCDREALMARQLKERFNIKQDFSDVQELLEIARPDVVHITTPPQSHYSLGKLCLEAGCNVYVEKPFTLNTEEAQGLIGLAKEKNLKITAGHNAQFTHAARRMREIIAEGFLGGKAIHIESYYCYDLSDRSYAKALLGDRNHWVRKLPGKLLQNVISHGISKVAEFLTGENPEVIAYGTTSLLLKNIGEEDIIDELRVIISDDNQRCTAYFTFSSQMRPLLHQLRIFGPKNGLIVDDDHQTVVRIKGAKYKSYLDQFVPPIDFAKEY